MMVIIIQIEPRWATNEIIKESADRAVAARRGESSLDRNWPVIGADWPQAHRQGGRGHCAPGTPDPLPGSISIPNPFSLTTRCLFIPVRYADVRSTQWVSLSSRGSRDGRGGRDELRFTRSTR